MCVCVCVCVSVCACVCVYVWEVIYSDDLFTEEEHLNSALAQSARAVEYTHYISAEG